MNEEKLPPPIETCENQTPDFYIAAREAELKAVREARRHCKVFDDPDAIQTYTRRMHQLIEEIQRRKRSPQSDRSRT